MTLRVALETILAFSVKKYKSLIFFSVLIMNDMRFVAQPIRVSHLGIN